MGLVCTSCTRKESGHPMASSTRDQGTSLNKPALIFEYFEKKRDPAYRTDPQKLQKISKINTVFNSASNYWLSENESLFDSTHRTAVTYRVDNMSQLLRVHNSIITENEYLAAKKIKELYLEYKKKKSQRPTSSPLTAGPLTNGPRVRLDNSCLISPIRSLDSTSLIVDD